MRRTRKAELVEALKQGLNSCDYARYTTSRQALRVRIYHLRAEGYEIETISEGQPGKHMSTVYKLVC